MTIKKKHWIILVIVAVAIAIGLTLYFLLRPTAYYPESIDPRTLHASPANKEMLVGLWQKDGHVFYRFEPDGKGHTWDVDDDITEDEASPFSWEAYEEATSTCASTTPIPTMPLSVLRNRWRWRTNKAPTKNVID